MRTLYFEFVLASSLCLQVGEELCAIMAMSERLPVIDWGATMESYCAWKRIETTV
jgi:hypothetical protein